MSNDPFDVDPYTWEPPHGTPGWAEAIIRRVLTDISNGHNHGWDFDPTEHFADNTVSPADADWHADRMDDRDQNWRAGGAG